MILVRLIKLHENLISAYKLIQRYGLVTIFLSTLRKAKKTGAILLSLML